MTLAGVAFSTLWLTAIIAVRYLLVAGLIHHLVWGRPEEKVRGLKLYARKPLPETARREIVLSLISSGVYALPAAIALEAWKHGQGRLYSDIHSHGGIAYAAVSVVIYLVLHDAFYYWAHRLMHVRALFKWTHAGHHRSREPTAFASFAFDPAEAALTGWFLPALTFLIPIHIGVALGVLILATVLAVFNHCGWEIYPERFMRGPVGGQMISALHHSLHHTRMRCNYGLYFRFWDRVMGTDAMPEPNVIPPVRGRTGAAQAAES